MSETHMFFFVDSKNHVYERIQHKGQIIDGYIATFASTAQAEEYAEFLNNKENDSE